ncbi:NUDIX domain-containing protein [Longispora fulva]|uniref:8-oxo-dGTP pyrophosphatase MutT (NUDIX family) n=1 Tax=Longispora fulva TaxID=619741 RepID=A0A8J7GNH0_9ACTN|nr:NUDIX domain-containing protein [Longispora fulva]MBG6133831.1 8-oxo-dGTP pyrophosphatase MutT (NUDIX family) [Longispora fulva]
MEWVVHSEGTVYENPWLTVNLADVELPDGRHLDHYVLRLRPIGATAIVDDRDRVLMIYRHRFITGHWGWELPAGVAEPGEEPVAAAAREAEEETGWRPVDLRPLLTVSIGSGLTDCAHHLFWTDRATLVGEPVDPHEASKIEWVPLADVAALLAAGELHEASTVAGLLRLAALRAGS